MKIENIYTDALSALANHHQRLQELLDEHEGTELGIFMVRFIEWYNERKHVFVVNGLLDDSAFRVEWRNSRKDKTMFNIGKLYQIKQYCWLLYPTKNIDCRPDATLAMRLSKANAAQAASYWSERFNCNVSYIPENSIFCLLEQDGNFLKVLSNDGELGWIIYLRHEEWAKDCIDEVIE